jgi:hypothetical protein
MITRRGWWLGAAATILCALVATAVPGSPPSSIETRALGVIVATTDAVLLYAFAARQFERLVIGWAAAVLLLLTPAHAYFVRTGSPRVLLPVPFLLGCALLLTAHQSELREATRRAPGRTLAARSIVGGAIGLCGISLTLLIGPIGSIRTVAWQRAATVADWFWTFFLPSNLFVKAEPLPSCGLFLAAAALPMAVGVYAMVREALEDPRAARLESLIVLVGSIAAPFGAAVTGVPPLISRALIVIPLGVLLSISGSLVMWNRWGLAGRVALVTLWIGGAVQAVVCQS